MSNKELLELAAKAAGIELFMPTHNGAWLDNTAGVRWNPLTDDGDALRLAVKLGLGISTMINAVKAGECLGFDGDGNLDETFMACEKFNDHDGDRFSATRLAITRAAAEIGMMTP